VSGQLHTPSRFAPWERARGTHSIAGWLGPRVGLDSVANIEIYACPCRDTNPGRPARRRVITQTAITIPSVYVIY
jgi:hypothetical protein